MDIGTVLSCSPHIVENIFQHLSAKDLGKCASVCSLWAVVSQDEIRKRKGIVPFFQGIKCNKHRKIHIDHQECSMRQASKFENELKVQLESVKIKPAFCIAFATSTFLEHFAQLFPTYFGCKPPRKRLKKCYWDYFDAAVKIALQKHLPPTCCTSLYIESDITFCGRDVQSNLVVTNSPAICGYLFPKFPDEEMKLYKRMESTGQILKKIIENGQKIKGTLNLVEFTSLPYFQIALNELRHRHDAFSSGVIMPVLTGSNYVPVFQGSNVQVFRLSIGNHDSSFEQHAITRMNECKAGMEEKGFTDKTIAFMFSIEPDNCYKVCEIFKMVYPGVPLVGLFKFTPMLHNVLNGQEDSTDFFDRLISRSLWESGLMCHCVFIFVTFNA